LAVGEEEHYKNHEEHTSRTASLNIFTERPGGQIGRYKLLSVLGEGGMGIVYLAEQEEPIRRRVALKIIKPGMDSKEVIARFEAERQALALLDHSNVVHIFEAGTTDVGRPYFAMEYVEGFPITEHCDRHRLTIEERLKLFLSVCETVQHAHQKAIIHRDIKPSNVLVTYEGEQAVPMIIDFGVAKALTQSLTERTLMTEQAHMIGTPEYMSPEQAEMTRQDIDTRTDIYSLGVVLYELLTGMLPFDAQFLREGGIEQRRRIICEREPETPSARLSTVEENKSLDLAEHRRTDIRTLRRRLHGELDWITLKAMEKDRTRRYQTAHALAEDIRRYLNQEPVLAGPPSTIYKMRKFVARNKSLITASVTVAVILLLATIVSVSQMVSAKAAAQRSRVAEAVAEAEGLNTRRFAYASDMHLAAQALSQDNLGRARDLLNRYRPLRSTFGSVSSGDLRGWEWRYLWKQAQSDALCEFYKETSEINSLAISHDGKWLAIGGRDKEGASVWDLQTRKQLAILHPEERFMRVAFSPREPLLAFSGVPNLAGAVDTRVNYDHSSIRLWDGASRQVVRELPLEGSCIGLKFSDDGESLFSWITDMSFTDREEMGNITVWSVPEGKKLASYAANQGSLDNCTTFAVNKDKTLAFHATRWGTIRAVDLSTGKKRWSTRAAEEAVCALALTQDGKVLASGAGFDEPTIRLWEVASGREIGRLEGHRAGWVADLLFWPDGKTLASAGADQTIRLWDVSDPCNGRLVRTLRGHTAEVWRIALLPDHKTLISGAKDGSVCIWDTEKPPRDAGSIMLENIAAWCFVPDGNGVLTLDRGGHVTRYRGPNLRDRQPLLDIPPSATDYLTQFSPDNRLLATGSTTMAPYSAVSHVPPLQNPWPFSTKGADWLPSAAVQIHMTFGISLQDNVRSPGLALLSFHGLALQH
jgi:serine/threonine protein kinase/WD40 repeat protein